MTPAPLTKSPLRLCARCYKYLGRQGRERLKKQRTAEAKSKRGRFGKRKESYGAEKC